MNDMIRTAESHIKNIKKPFAGAHSCRKFPFAALMVLMLLIFSMTGCGADEEAGAGKDADSANSDKIKVVAAIAPVYDWTRNVIIGADEKEKKSSENESANNDVASGKEGETSKNVELTLLLDKGVDLHSYQPTAEDLNTISHCDLFIYVGGESDKWVSDALAQAENKDMRVISLMDILGDKAKEEEHKEGMQEERGESDEDDEGESLTSSEDNDPKKDNEEEPEYDEHVWLSLRNAELFTEKLASELEKLDAENANKYKKNAAAYISKLDALDKEYVRTIQAGKTNTLIFADRFPFRYMTDDYGLDYYAAFNGCSSESAASFETMTFLADKLGELSVKYVMTIDGSDKKMARSVIDIAKTKDPDRKYEILMLDSMQSSSKDQIDGGDDYLTVMKKNLSVLNDALN